MKKLPISIGILSWHSGQVLVDTLTTYYNNGLFDIVDDFRIGKFTNYTLKHFIERVKIYDEEKFNYKFYNIELKNANG